MYKRIHEPNRELAVSPRDGVYDDYKKNRKILTVTWPSKNHKKAIAIGINPSKADDEKSDKTVTSIGRFLDMYGFDEFKMLNLFTIYTTNQKYIDPTTRTNFSEYIDLFKETEMIFVAWGVQKKYIKEKKAALAILLPFMDKVYCMENQEGKQPMHPSRINYDYKLSKLRGL